MEEAQVCPLGPGHNMAEPCGCQGTCSNMYWRLCVPSPLQRPAKTLCTSPEAEQTFGPAKGFYLWQAMLQSHLENLKAGMEGVQGHPVGFKRGLGCLPLQVPPATPCIIEAQL